jgi:hypothetical protein
VKPSVGVESAEYRSVCVYSAEPGAPQCDEQATVHVRVISLEYGEVCMASCDPHASIARVAGLYRDEHPYAGFCGFPSSLWYATHCDLDALAGYSAVGGAEGPTEKGS